MYRPQPDNQAVFIIKNKAVTRHARDAAQPEIQIFRFGGCEYWPPMHGRHKLNALQRCVRFLPQKMKCRIVKRYMQERCDPPKNTLSKPEFIILRIMS